jgi:MFS family permease
MLQLEQAAPGHPKYNYILRRNVKKSLRLSVMDGGACAAMLGLTQNYITPFALALKATTAQIGLLASLPSFAMALSQLAAPNLAERAGSRKGLILPIVFVHAFMWLPVFLLPVLFPASGVWLLIALVTVSTVSGAMANPAWGSMMADLVHEGVRGRYFSFRGRIAGFITLVFALIGGLVLQSFTGNVFIGFGIIFGGAMIFRLLSLYFLSRMYEPPLAPEREKLPSLPYMVTRLGNSNLGRFTLYAALLYFATMIAGPFFSVYMLRNLHFSYVTYTLVTAASTISSLFFLPFWGRRADRAGNLKIIRITSVLMPFIPLVWLVSSNAVYLIAANMFSGFAWSGFELAMVNFVYDASEARSRTKQIAVFNAVTGLAVCFGALAGGFLAPRLPAFLGYEMRTLFTISGVMRGLVVMLLLHTIVEVRQVPRLDTFQLLLGRTGLLVKARAKMDKIGR